MDAKRSMDVAVSALGLAVSSPVMLVVAAAVALDSPGGVIFRQERVGLAGEVFRIRKFRTMRAVHDGLAVSTFGDSRVTRVGRVLRRTKLDELPQLLDVLEGHLSLVGPRPEVPQYVAQWPADLRPVILSVRPGITDPVSIQLRNEAELLARAEDPEQYYREVLLPRKARGYADYVRNRSLHGDLVVLARTAAAVMLR